MRRSYFHRLPLGLIAASLAIVGSAATLAQTSTVIIAPSAPPASRIEAMPPPLATKTMTWQAGHWAWNGSAWTWEDGRYVQAPQAQAVWEPGHWEQQAPGGYVWIDGRWHG